MASIAAAVLTSLQTFFNFASQAEIHRVEGVKYKAILRELEVPVVPERIYRRIQARYDNVDFVKKVPVLVNGAKL